MRIKHYNLRHMGDIYPTFSTQLLRMFVKDHYDCQNYEDYDFSRHQLTQLVSKYRENYPDLFQEEMIEYGKNTQLCATDVPVPEQMSECLYKARQKYEGHNSYMCCYYGVQSCLNDIFGVVKHRKLATINDLRKLIKYVKNLEGDFYMIFTMEWKYKAQKYAQEHTFLLMRHQGIDYLCQSFVFQQHLSLYETEIVVFLELLLEMVESTNYEECAELYYLLFRVRMYDIPDVWHIEAVKVYSVEEE